MIPRKIFENLVNNEVYVYVKRVGKEFAGIVKSINECDILVVEDKNNNLSYIPISEVIVITERR